MKTRSAILVIVLMMVAAGQGAESPAQAQGGITVDPATRTVENAYIKIVWDLSVAERVTELYLKDYDPTYNLTASYLGEFTGHAYYVPLSGAWIGLVHPDNTDHTWDYHVSGEYVTISISSVSPGGVRVSTTYRITADSPAILVTRTFGFGSTPIEASRLAPYALRAHPRSHFTTFVYPRTDGTIASTTATCEGGCPKYDWDETWIDIEAPSWDVGLGLVNLAGNPSSYAWLDRDMYSSTSYVTAAIPGPSFGDDLEVSYVLYPHLGDHTAVDWDAIGSDLGFRPNPNGFQFNNKRTERTWPMFEQFFGSTNVTNPDGSPCKAAKSFFHDRYRTVANGWSCLGFSQTSLLSYLDWAQPNAGPFAMSHFPQLYQQPESTQLTNPIAYYSGVQTAKQWADGYYNSWLSACDTDSYKMIETIRVGITTGKPVVVSLNTFVPSLGSHAVAPYRVEEIGPTAVDVYVYDSEEHGEENVIHFEDPGSGWQWKYTFLGSVAGAGTRTGGCKDMYPYGLLTGTQQGIPPVNWCESPSDVLESSLDFSQRILAHVPAEGEWVVEDAIGRRLGWVNGEFVAEIPEAYSIPQALGDAVLLYRSLYLPAAAYSISVSDSPTRTIEYSVFGDGSLVRISQNLQAVGCDAQLTVSPDLRQITLSGLQDLSSLTLLMDYESSIDSRWATVIGADLTGSEDLNASFDGNRLVMSRLADDLQYRFGLEVSDGQRFKSQPLTLVGNATHSVIPVNWSDLESAGVLLEMDYDSDGTVDETRLLHNIQTVYLPLVSKGH